MSLEMARGSDRIRDRTAASRRRRSDRGIRVSMSAQKSTARRPVSTYGDDHLQTLQRNTFRYFWQETNPENGLIPDNTAADDVPASIAGVGFALASYPVAVERSFVPRAQAVERTLATLRFFWNAPQGPMPDATGHRGFFYHFLDVMTGRRAWRSELSTIDTTILVAGALTAAAYFDQATDAEREVRTLADSLYRRLDWRWAQNGASTVSHGWKPTTGFLRDRWEGYCEALILYVLGLGSPTHPLPEKSYRAWTASYRWKKLYGHEFLYGAPLFMHQLSHVWIDFREIQDTFMRRQAMDYFENSRRATYVNQQYAIAIPRAFAAMASTFGASPQATARGRRRAVSEESHGASWDMSREACRMVLTTARWLRGLSQRRCHSLPKSCAPPCSAAARPTPRWKTNTVSSAASIQPFQVAGPGVLVGSRKTTSRSIRGRSF
jgi:hypothetical protein